MPVISLNRVERRRVSVFLSCLLVAVFAWLFFALSNTHDYEVKSRINFVNPPINKAYYPLQDDTVTMKVNGTGWQLLFSKLKLRPRTVNISLRQLSTGNYVTLSNQLINRRLSANQKIISVSPDTLFFDFTHRMTKRVPVKLVYKLSFLKSFGLSGPIKIEPSTVIVTGAAEDLRGISFWRTDSLFLNRINSSFTAKIGFQKGTKNNVDVYPKFVRVEIPIDEFTEKVIELPIEVVNNPGKDVMVVPEKAKVTLLTALSKYSRISRDSIEIGVDLNNWTKNKYAQLPVRITRFPSYCKLVKTEPQIVDFLVKE